MTIETAGVSSPVLAEYADIPIAFDVESVLLAAEGVEGREWNEREKSEWGAAVSLGESARPLFSVRRVPR